MCANGQVDADVVFNQIDLREAPKFVPKSTQFNSLLPTKVVNDFKAHCSDGQTVIFVEGHRVFTTVALKSVYNLAHLLPKRFSAQASFVPNTEEKTKEDASERPEDGNKLLHALKTFSVNLMIGIVFGSLSRTSLDADLTVIHVASKASLNSCHCRDCPLKKSDLPLTRVCAGCFIHPTF